MNFRSLIVLPMLFATVACSSPLEFADWTIPVSDDTRIIEYAATLLEERVGQQIAVEEDLVLGTGPGDAQHFFFQRPLVVPGGEADIYVLDRGNHRIQVFDGNGRYLHTLGRQGQGPGELQYPHSIAVARDRVAVLAMSNRLSIWGLDGEHLEEVQLPNDLSDLKGVDDGFIARRAEWLGDMLVSSPPTRRFTFAFHGTDGEEKAVYTHADQPPPAPIDFRGSRTEFAYGVLMVRGGMLPTFDARFAASRNGAVYVTTSEEYQIHAYGPQRWSLRVAWERAEVTPQDIVAEMERSSPLKDAPASAFEWPEKFRAVANLLVDGHGHLYVFPYTRRDESVAGDSGRPRTDRLVDVFSADGVHLFSGLISLDGWTGARGDFVFGTRANATTEEDEVVRYRLIEPFE